MPELCYLYGFSTEKELEDFKTLAAVHGINVDEESKNQSQSVTNHKKDNKPIFGDPSEYEKLSQEERIKLTEQMMNRLQGFVADPIKTASKNSL